MGEAALTAALAGLLHNIGRFALVANSQNASLLLDQNLNNEEVQAELTAHFVHHYVPASLCPSLLPMLTELKDQATRDKSIINNASNLAEGDKPDNIPAAARQLLSIFCDVCADEQTAADAYLPPATLEMDEHVIFPDVPLPHDDVVKRYQQLWDSFVADVEVLRQAHGPNANPVIYLESLQLLMQRYLWCVPLASYNGRPDVNMYDHSRMTGALAAIFTESTPNVSPDQPLALLVGGDLSGVQDFIYTISSRGATSALRGRSFYLQLLVEAVARYLLRRLDHLPLTNLIYAGGGNFYILARPDDAQRLQVIQREISHILLHYHRGSLYMVMGSVPLRERDFSAGETGAAWIRLSDELQKAKQHRFAEMGEDLREVFKPRSHGGNQEQQCQVCGVEDSQTQVDPASPGVTEEDKTRKCPACFSYEGLGRDLRKAEYLTFEQRDIPALPALDKFATADWKDVLSAFGICATLSNRLEGIPKTQAPCTVLALSDAALKPLMPQQQRAIGRRFLVNVTPLMTADDIRDLSQRKVEDLSDVGDVKTFDAMAAQSIGVQRLGVMRMDIDNLGDIFSKGLGEKSTLSRMASLSFTISLFVEGWVEQLAMQINRRDQSMDEGERLYSIYSGGDDLFFVGAWDAVIDLARMIPAGLARFTAQHPGIHCSAGVVLVDNKYPLAQAASDAQVAEQRAKQERWYMASRKGSKNAVCFLNQVLPWQRFGIRTNDSASFLSDAYSLQKFLCSLDESVRMPLVRLLIDLQLRQEESARSRREQGKDQNKLGESQVLWGPWHWYGAYMLARMADRLKDEPRRSVEMLCDQLQQDHYRSIEWIGFAARWAELALRKE